MAHRASILGDWRHHFRGMFSPGSWHSRYVSTHPRPNLKRPLGRWAMLTESAGMASVPADPGCLHRALCWPLAWRYDGAEWRVQYVEFLPFTFRTRHPCLESPTCSLSLRRRRLCRDWPKPQSSPGVASGPRSARTWCLLRNPRRRAGRAQRRSSGTGAMSRWSHICRQVVSRHAKKGECRLRKLSQCRRKPIQGLVSHSILHLHYVVKQLIGNCSPPVIWLSLVSFWQDLASDQRWYETRAR